MTFLVTWGCASDFLEMSTRGQLKFFVGTNTKKKLKARNYLNFTIKFPTISRCAGDFFKVLLKCKMAAMDKLHNFL